MPRMETDDYARGVWDLDYELDDPTREQTFARAKHKLEAIRNRSAVPIPAGRYAGRVFGCIFTLAIVGGLCWGAYFGLTEDDEMGVYVASFLLVVAALLLIPAYRLLAGSRATTPFRALNLYYRQLGAGREKGARKLVVPNDFDRFPREFPSLPSVKGYPGVEWLRFDQPGDYQAYWNAMLRWPTGAYCIARVRGLELEEIAPDVVRCEFTLRLGIGSQLWFLLIFTGPGLILAFILDAATRTNIKASMSKVLVRVEDEWHLLNGAWHEADDKNSNWV